MHYTGNNVFVNVGSAEVDLACTIIAWINSSTKLEPSIMSSRRLLFISLTWLSSVDGQYENLSFPRRILHSIPNFL